MGMTPEKYRRGAVAAIVRYTTAASPLGRMLIAATDKGICAIQFADSERVAARIDAGVSVCGAAAGRRGAGGMEGQSGAVDRWPGPASFSAARYSRDGVSAAGVGVPAENSAGRNAILQRGGEKDRHAEGDRGRWRGHALRIRWRWRFRAIVWCARMGRQAATGGVWSGRSGCWRWRRTELRTWATARYSQFIHNASTNTAEIYFASTSYLFRASSRMLSTDLFSASVFH